MKIRSVVKKYAPWPALYIYRKIYYLPKDLPAVLGFLFRPTKSPTSPWSRLKLVGMFYLISYKVDCPHTEHELLAVSKKILNLGNDVPGVIVEAGSYFGGSTAKLSLVASLCNRKLEVFDSFEGMPENNETHGKSIFKREHHFPKGSHAVALETVKRNVLAYGDASRCQFHKGWFKDTMRDFHEPVALACINADLVQSTKDCLKYLCPLMSHGGIIFSQDGHFPWIIDVLKKDSYWQNELGINKPPMEGLGTSKLVAISF
jgi:O-methyltransferase